MNFWKKLFTKNKEEVKEVAREQLIKNAEVIQSLKDYDEGKKDISTTELEKRLPNIRVAPRG
jgi:hypothetical protein